MHSLFYHKLFSSVSIDMEPGESTSREEVLRSWLGIMPLTASYLLSRWMTHFMHLIVKHLDLW